MNLDPMDLAVVRQAVESEMEALGISQNQIADRMGISRQAVTNILAGRSHLSMERAARLAAAFWPSSVLRPCRISDLCRDLESYNPRRWEVEQRGDGAAAWSRKAEFLVAQLCLERLGRAAAASSSLYSVGDGYGLHKAIKRAQEALQELGDRIAELEVDNGED